MRTLKTRQRRIAIEARNTPKATIHIRLDITGLRK
jgi:hypothetical protein